MRYENILVEDGHIIVILNAIEIIDHHNSVLEGRFLNLKETNEVVF